MPTTPLKVPTDGEKTRLDERIPPTPMAPDGTVAPGLTDATDPPVYRTPGQRDRDRILYSAAFQRLGGVTQVTESESGYTFHTRLTHSMKVAQIARRLTEKLLVDYKESGDRAGQLVKCLDPDASEAAALAHDLGHPPFGHVAEEWLRDHTDASFEGNAQTFRILTELAQHSFGSTGLELTRRTLNGALKYPWPRQQEKFDPAHPERSKKWGSYEADEDAFKWVRADSLPHERSLTAELMDWADDLTYAVHDLDDFFRAGLIPLDRLLHEGKPTAEVERFREGLKESEKDASDERVEALVQALRRIDVVAPYDGNDEQRAQLGASASSLITQYLSAVAVENGSQDGKANFVIKDDAKRQVDILKDLTWVYVVRRPSLAVMQAGRTRIIQSLHGWYMDATKDGDARLIPPAYRPRLAGSPDVKARSRVINDLVSGLTEEAAQALYRRMSGAEPGSVLDGTAHVR